MSRRQWDDWGYAEFAIWLGTMVIGLGLAALVLVTGLGGRGDAAALLVGVTGALSFALGFGMAWLWHRFHPGS